MPTKKERSNSQRLAALRERKECLAKQTLLHISDSLPSKSSNHTIFDDGSGNEGKLTLFEGSDDDDSPVEFSDKFEGAGGEKLLRLQRQIGVDSRFRLSETFVDSDQGQDSEDDLVQEESERAKSLSVINSLLGSTGPLCVDKPKTEDIVIPLRYDPFLSNHTSLEQSSHPVLSEPSHAVSDLSSSEDDTPDNKSATQDKYFTVNTDLKDLFGSSPQGVSFLGSHLECSDQEDMEQEPLVKSVQSPVVMSTVEEALDDTCLVGESSNVKFFSQCLDHSFYRPCPLRELERGWAEKRDIMKQSFRKRRKDAVKLAYKTRKHAPH